MKYISEIITTVAELIALVLFILFVTPVVWIIGLGIVLYLLK